MSTGAFSFYATVLQKYICSAPQNALHLLKFNAMTKDEFLSGQPFTSTTDVSNKVYKFVAPEPEYTWSNGSVWTGDGFNSLEGCVNHVTDTHVELYNTVLTHVVKVNVPLADLVTVEEKEAVNV